MNTFGKLKDILLGHLTRNGVAMQTEGGVDMVGAAINSALTYIQRSRDFEWNKTDIRIHCNPKGDLLTNAVDLDTNQPIQIKRILQAYGTTKPGICGGPKVDYLSKSSQVARNTYGQQCGSAPERVIHSATKVFACPTPDGGYDLYFEAVKWLQPLVHELDSNFLLDYGLDFLLYRTLKALNL